jgi:hypothetical protein
MNRVSDRHAVYSRDVRLPLRFISPLLLAGVVVAGCGSSASSSQTTQAKFVERANAICTKATQLGHQLHAPKGLTETISFLEEARALVARTGQELQAVSPPASSRAAYRRFLAAVTREAHSLSELTSAVRAGDKARYQATTRKMEANTANRQATALGLGDCAETTKPQGK